MSNHGGARPGSGRPRKMPGPSDRAAVLGVLDTLTSPAALDALFADARAGSIPSFKILATLYDQAALIVAEGDEPRADAKPDLFGTNPARAET